MALVAENLYALYKEILYRECYRCGVDLDNDIDIYCKECNEDMDKEM